MSDSIVATAPAETLTPAEQAAAPEPSWKWWWSRDAERYEGPFDSYEDALADARDKYQSEHAEFETVAIVEAYQAELTDDIFDAWDVIESFNEWNEEHADPEGDGCIDVFRVTADQRQELEAALKMAWSAWRAKHKLGTAWSFAASRNESTVTIADIDGMTKPETA